MKKLMNKHLKIKYFIVIWVVTVFAAMYNPEDKSHDLEKQIEQLKQEREKLKQEYETKINDLYNYNEQQIDSVIRSIIYSNGATPNS